jgi:transcriptional regulator with XRE-family HTH domain
MKITKVEELRRARNLRQYQLAEATGLSSATISRLEAGTSRGSTDSLVKLARFYGVPLEDLIEASG